MLRFIKKHWPILVIGTLLLFISIQNFHPETIVLGNDNFSPEINPTITLERSLLNPAWRTYRVLGIPSDSEQGDLWRTLIFWLVGQVVPAWTISQIYILLTLLIGVLSMGMVAKLVFPFRPHLSQFFGSLLYLCSLLTIWVYFYPVHLFVAAYAFTPLVIWRMLESLNHPSRKNYFLLFLSSLLTGTTALTATMWITTSLTIFATTLVISIKNRIRLTSYIKSVTLYTLPHFFWILPFITYVISNNQALQNSYINREITATTIQSEGTSNNALNTLRFANSWLDTKEDDINYTYPYRDWFKSNKYGIIFGYVPAMLAIIGLLTSILRPKKQLELILIGILGFFGWLFLNGNNPPFGSVYSFFDQKVPLFHQVFRWGSSKFWPLLFIPMLLLAVQGISTLYRWFKFLKLHYLFVVIVTISLVISTYPIVTDFMIRREVFVQVPPYYSIVSDQLAPNNRVDTVPHTNTRYFRRYDWGFWGSVILNYILPNPTTEKALIIGSNENETAYNVLNEAYNSGSPAIYSRALDRYNIVNVLSDKSVTHEGLGNSYSYPYDWKLHNKVIENNPRLSPIFTSGKLAIYKAMPPISPKTIPVQPAHNSEILSKILTVTGGPNYIQHPNKGFLFPLAAQYSDIQLNPNTLDMITHDLQPASYTLNIDEAILVNSPMLASVSNDTLTLRPYFPSLSVNNAPLYELPKSDLSIPTNNSFISIGEQIIKKDHLNIIESPDPTELSLWDRSISTDLLLMLTNNPLVPCNQDEEINASSTYDQEAHTLTISSSPRACIQLEHPISSNTAAELIISTNSDKPSILDICVHSLKQNRCLNKSKIIYIDTSLQTQTIPLDYVVAEGDSLAIFILKKTYLDQTSDVNITQLSLTSSTSSTSKKLTLPSYKAISTSITIASNDSMTTSLPITGQIPSLQPFFIKCEDRGLVNKFERDENNQIYLTDSNCFDGLYSSFSLPSSQHYPALITYLSSKYVQGIPLELNLKQDKNLTKIMTDLTYTKKDNELFKFTLLPTDNQNFTLEIINKGIGKNPSINTLSAFQAIPIPESWLALSLVPNNLTQISVTPIPTSTSKDTGTFIVPAANSSIYSISQSTSPYWKLVHLDTKTNIIGQYLAAITHKSVGAPTTVNGWQQAWIIENDTDDGYYSVVFFPNILAYFGLFFGIGTAILLVIKHERKQPSA